MTTGRLLDTREAAELIGLSYDALRVMRQRGQGPRYIRFGRRVRYAPGDLMSWIRDHREVTSSDSQDSVGQAKSTTPPRYRAGSRRA